MHFATFLVSYLFLEKRIIRPAVQTTLQQQVLAIYCLQTGTMKMRFQISEQITIIKSQIWTIGRVIKLKKFRVGNSLLCNKWLVNWHIVLKKPNTQWQFPPRCVWLMVSHNLNIISASSANDFCPISSELKCVLMKSLKLIDYCVAVVWCGSCAQCFQPFPDGVFYEVSVFHRITVT